jgi:hypothetical protein
MIATSNRDREHPAGIFALACLALALLGACTPSAPPSPATPTPTRLSTIPADVVKVNPQTDAYPPVLHSDAWEQPRPLGPPIDTAGAEDSPFITPDGQHLYFVFTPDVRVPVEKQLLDGVTGLYSSERQGDGWGEPQRVVLTKPGELALDGCEFLEGNTLWFCSARAGNYRGVDLWQAQLQGDHWGDIRNAGEQLNQDCQVGEMHLSADGATMYFHRASSRPQADLDIWVTNLVGDQWTEPENVRAVNTDAAEGWPSLSQDGRELWFTRWFQGSPAVFRSILGPGGWGEPELIVSSFAGEPSLDVQGDLYFVHHFYRDGKMIEADIYTAPRR